jgi:hypothetical protein
VVAKVEPSRSDIGKPYTESPLPLTTWNWA